MVCSGIEVANKTIGGLLQYPTSCYHWFWLWIIGGLWFLFIFLIHYYDSQKVASPNWISAIGVSSIVIVFISVAGSYVKIGTSSLIPSDILIYIVVWCFICILIWIFKK